eukprot:TRINITY_DN6208_c0_g1_i19.p3 TRINITY_DN6208_c0_g1~~TRINITY_DN6208_c0_g1_i19.p3  ORF type:complete len:120 (-),score=7.82 TRINITY_DN6208_c0_g1_i19:1695-2054(-)
MSLGRLQFTINVILGNEFLNGRTIIDLVKHKITVTPTQEDCTTASMEDYRKYIIDKQDKDITNIQARPIDLKHIIEHLCYSYPRSNMKGSWPRTACKPYLKNSIDNIREDTFSNIDLED